MALTMSRPTNRRSQVRILSGAFSPLHLVAVSRLLIAAFQPKVKLGASCSCTPLQDVSASSWSHFGLIRIRREVAGRGFGSHPLRWFDRGMSVSEAGQFVLQQAESPCLGWGFVGRISVPASTRSIARL
jgi:hypothetical protein